MVNENKKNFEDFFQELKNGLKETYRDGKKYLEFLQTTSNWKKYSQNNKIYLWMQCLMNGMEGRYLNTFQGWNELGFKVNKGEKAMEILLPSFEKYFKNEEDKWISVKKANEQQKIKINNGEFKIKEVVNSFFFKKTLFDIQQTNCPQNEYEKKIREKLIPKSLEESQDKRIDFLFLTLKNHLINEEKLNVVFEEMKEGTKGYIDFENNLALNKENTNMQNLKTIIHEYSHFKLHMNSEKQLQTFQEEIEAESIAYLVCKNFDIDTSDYSFKYINAYGASKTEEELYKSYEKISATASSINEVLEEALKLEMNNILGTENKGELAVKTINEDIKVKIIWTEVEDKRYFQDGEIMSFKEANERFKEVEREVRNLKEIAKEKGEYYRYLKTKFDIILPEGVKDENRFDIGDGYAEDLLHYCEKTYGKKFLDKYIFKDLKLNEYTNSIVKCENNKLMYLADLNAGGKFEAYKIKGEDYHILSFLLNKDELNNLKKDSAIDLSKKHIINLGDIKEKVGSVNLDIGTKITEYKRFLKSKNLIKEVKSNPKNSLENKAKLSKGLDFSIK